MRNISTDSWKGKKAVHICALILFLGGLIFSILSYFEPLMNRKIKTVNTIHIITSYSIEEPVKPNALFPDGTVLHPKKTVSAVLSDYFVVHMKTVVKANKPVEIKGAFHPNLKISSGDLWTKTFKIKGGKSFHSTCRSCVINRSFPIQAKHYLNYLDQMESKLHFHFDNYKFLIDPNMKGNVYFHGSAFPIKSGNGLLFNRDQNQLTLQDGSKKTISKTDPVKLVSSSPNTFRLAGASLPVKSVRLISPVLTIFLLILYILTRENGNQKLEFETIDRKYRKLLVPIEKQLKMEVAVELEVSAFEPLVYVSEERERPILRYNTHAEVLYMVADDPYVYYYAISKEKQEKGP